MQVTQHKLNRRRDNLWNLAGMLPLVLCMGYFAVTKIFMSPDKTTPADAIFFTNMTLLCVCVSVLLMAARCFMQQWIPVPTEVPDEVVIYKYETMDGQHISFTEGLIVSPVGIQDE